MKEIASGVYYCGLHDKNRKLFDQLVPLPQGTTYNSYLVKGAQKCALIDTMYEKLLDPYRDMLSACGLKIDYIVSNHAEPDHSGAIPTLLEAYPEAVVLCSPKCAENLSNMLGVDPSRMKVVADGEEIDLGGRTLKFFMTPWVHWPDTMFTFLVEDKFLFPCDYFGAHYTANELFADCSENLAEAARRYYAEIMMPFRGFCSKYLDIVRKLEPKMILPSHGPVYDKPDFIINLYSDWTSDKFSRKVLIPYVSMYDNTRIMVDYLENALKSRGISVVKAELVDADTDLTNTLTRIRRRSWERIWLAAAYGLALVSLAVWLSDGNPVRSLLGILLASAIVVIAVLRIEFKTRELQARLTESSGRGWYADEDDKWLGGVVYYDPHDTRTVVNCRVGSSTTVNLARPNGRVLAGMAALILLAMPFTGALIDAVTNRPTSLELTNTELVAYCGDKSAYRIERADIESAELLDELPEHLVRSVGTGAENLLKGDFSAAEYGRLKLCLDPTCPPFLLVECAGGETYLLGSRTEGETEVIFGEIGA